MDRSQFSDSKKSELITAASRVASNAYTPYSNYKVGAAVLLEGGDIFLGCNIENSSYGLTVCAERCAIFSAVSAKGTRNMEVRAIAVVNDDNSPCAPCGACRQVMAELAPEAIVIFRDDVGLQEVRAMHLLPKPFRLTQT